MIGEQQKKEVTAKEIFNAGANCSEAIWQAFSTHLTEDEQKLGNHLAGGFGGGISAGDICGAIAGGVLVLGLHYGRDPGAERKKELKELGKKFYQMAQAELGSVYCRDLRNLQEENYRAKCAVIVEKMAALVEALLTEKRQAEGGNCS
ncbi:MAG: C-GCAxxG-C-C family (seleno)protein [bacterium]|jgi:C_GCAxxG_C_C family probable redox protein